MAAAVGVALFPRSYMKRVSDSFYFVYLRNLGAEWSVFPFNPYSVLDRF
jgi:hypothetical protein